VRGVLDTNVLVSGLLTPHGPTGRVVDLLLAGQVVLLADDRILGEYIEVLGRPKFAFRPEDIVNLLEYLRATAELVVAPPLRVRVAQVVTVPDQRHPDRPGRDVFQRRLPCGDPGRDYLARVFVDMDRTPAEVVTAYRTSKIDKYWRAES